MIRCQSTEIIQSPLQCSFRLTEVISGLTSCIFEASTNAVSTNLLQKENDPLEYSFLVDGVKDGEVRLVISDGMIEDLCGNTNIRSNTVILEKGTNFVMIINIKIPSSLNLFSFFNPHHKLHLRFFSHFHHLCQLQMIQ